MSDGRQSPVAHVSALAPVSLTSHRGHVTPPAARHARMSL